MATLNSIQNVHVLISHRSTYGAPRTIDDILAGPVSGDLLCLLSALSFDKDEEKRFRSWSWANLPAFRKESDTLSGNSGVVFGSLQIFECWKQLLARAGTLQVAAQSRVELAGVLHELFATINDQEDEGNFPQYVAKSSIHFSRDDRVFKLYRAQKIFLDGKHVAPYVEAFERKNGFTVEMYLYVIFSIIKRCYSMQKGASFDPVKVDKWIIDLNEVSSDLKIDLKTLQKIMSEIAFTVDDGVALMGTEEGSAASFQLFRSHPFLQLSDTCFLPIEGKLVEELLFDNLLHRIHQVAGVGMQFFADFGRDFEDYTQGLIEKFCSSNNQISYEYIQEFKFGKSNSLSPDAMVRCDADKTVISFEVKSARYLDSLLTSADTPEGVGDSFEKLRFKPWEQMYDAMGRIIGGNQHVRLTKDLSHLFVAITMNEIPISMQDYQVNIADIDQSRAFYSFGIHTFERLLITANATGKYPLSAILHRAFDKRLEISNRTTFLRVERTERGSSELERQIKDETIQRLLTSQRR